MKKRVSPTRTLGRTSDTTAPIRSGAIVRHGFLEALVTQWVDDFLRSIRQASLDSLIGATSPRDGAPNSAPAEHRVPAIKGPLSGVGRRTKLDDLPLGGRILAEVERETIRQTLEQLRGNRTRAASSLGIAVSTLYEKMKKYRL